MLLTDEPDLHIVMDGRRIDAVAEHSSVYLFHLPEPGDVVVASRAAIPAEHGIARDPRPLGVAIHSIEIRQGPRLRQVTADDTALSDGFHCFEVENGWRWTDGAARLPVTLFAGFQGPVEFVVHVACATRYPLIGDPVAFAAAA